MPKKIIIIGAGPIGCYTAQLLKTFGYDPLLIEEHGEVGRPIHCTGLVGHKVFEEKWSFNLSTSSIVNTINGAVIHYNNQHFVLEREKVAYVIDRERFDKELSKDLNILYENQFLSIKKSGPGYIVTTNKKEVYADIIIGADGANSVMRKILNQNTNHLNYYKGIQLKIKFQPKYRDFVEVYLKKPFFFWVVPETENIVRVGTISENPSQDLYYFLKEVNIKGEVLDSFGGIVCVGICSNTVKENIALVGDAACQVKPLSYGGIYFGLKAASILTFCIKNNRIKDYDILWKKELAPEIRIGLKIRQIYNRLSSEEIEKIFKLLKDQKWLIENIGDFENHSHLILEIIRNPHLYPQLRDLFLILFNKYIKNSFS